MKPNTLRSVLALFIAAMGAWITCVAPPILIYPVLGSSPCLGSPRMPIANYPQLPGK
jgi:hypothetical protein